MFEHFFDANLPFAGLVNCHWPMPLHGLAATGPFRENELFLWKVHVLSVVYLMKRSEWGLAA